MISLDKAIGGLAILSVPFRAMPDALEVLNGAQAQLMAYKRLLARDGLPETWEEDEDLDELPFGDAEAPGEAAEDFWDDGWPLDDGG